MLRLTVLLFCGYAAVIFDAQIHELYNTLPREEFIEYFNKQNFSWQITYYKELEGINVACSKKSKDSSLPMITHSQDDYKELPEYLDAREKWSDCETIKEIYCQYDDHGKRKYCGSCWTFGTATTASDRTCIHTGRTVRLAEQDFECCDDCDGDNVCEGGYPENAFEYWINEGLVTQKCKPYDIDELIKGVCNQTCQDESMNYKSDKHYGQNMYQIDSSDNDIRAELFKNGPVETGFDVYEDFINYKGGIYEYKYGPLKGGHSVRVIGYGVEKGVKYWLAANSWGRKWGEDGFFRIKRFQEIIGFEQDVLGAFPKK